MPDRVLFYPYDALPRRLEDADALLARPFPLRRRQPLRWLKDRSSTSLRRRSVWSLSLHEFDWLPPLAAAGGEPARKLATNLMSQWVRRYARYSEPSWAPHVMARRLMQHLRAWPLRAVEFRHAVALEDIRVAARTMPPAGAERGRSAGRPAAIRSGVRARAFRYLPRRQHQAPRPRARAPRSADRAPDPAGWRPYEPLAGDAASLPIATS